MKLKSSITAKGQVTIPKEISRHLKMKAGDRVKFFLHPDGSVALLPKQFSELRLAAPEPEILRLLGEESERKSTHKITSKQIGRVVSATRARRPKSG